MIKFDKFLKKTLFVFPFAYALWIAKVGFDFTDILFDLFAAFLCSCILIFYNIFDYNAFPDVKNEDFLETKHSVIIENTPFNNNKIEENIHHLNIKNVYKEETFTAYEIQRKLLNSILIITKSNAGIRIEIKYKYLNFLPDFAINYNTLKSILQTK